MKKKLEQLLRELLVDPTSQPLLQKIGGLLQKLGNNREAAKYFDRLAHEYARDGYFLKAVALSKQVIKLDPDAVGARERLISLYLQLDLYREAAEVETELRARARDVDELRRLDELIAKLRPLARD